MGNGQHPDAPNIDAEDWADLLDDAEPAAPVPVAGPASPLPLASTAMVAPEPFARDEDETATMPLDRARLGVPRPPGGGAPAVSLPPIPRKALTPRPHSTSIPLPGASPHPRQPVALPLPALGRAAAPAPVWEAPPGLPTASTPLGDVPVPPALPPAPAAPVVAPPPRAQRVATALYGDPSEEPAGPASVSLSSVPPSRGDAQSTLLDRLPVRPGVPSRASASLAWDDDDEVSLPSTPMPAWAHGSTSALEADDRVVKAIAGEDEPPPATASSPPAGDGFVSFGDADEFQFDLQTPGDFFPLPPASVPLTPMRAASHPGGALPSTTPVPTGEPDGDDVFDLDARPVAPTHDGPSSPSEGAAPASWRVPTEEGGARALPSLPPLDDALPASPLLPPALEQASQLRTRKPTPSMPMATLAALLDDAAAVEDSAAPGVSAAPSMPSEAQPPPPPPPPPADAPVVDHDAVWASWLPAAEASPAVDEKSVVREAMRGCLAREDFADALSEAERLLQLDRDDREARQVVLRCREELRALYSRRLGPLDQIPSTVVPTSEIRWLSLDHRAGFVLSLIDGVCTIEDMIDVSTMPSLEVLRTLHSLLTQKVIVLRGARPRR